MGGKGGGCGYVRGDGEGSRASKAAGCARAVLRRSPSTAVAPSPATTEPLSRCRATFGTGRRGLLALLRGDADRLWWRGCTGGDTCVSSCRRCHRHRCRRTIVCQAVGLNTHRRGGTTAGAGGGVRLGGGVQRGATRRGRSHLSVSYWRGQGGAWGAPPARVPGGVVGGWAAPPGGRSTTAAACGGAPSAPHPRRWGCWVKTLTGVAGATPHPLPFPTPVRSREQNDTTGTRTRRPGWHAPQWSPVEEREGGKGRGRPAAVASLPVQPRAEDGQVHCPGGASVPLLVGREQVMGGGGGAILTILRDLPFGPHRSDLTMRQRAADGGCRTGVC